MYKNNIIMAYDKPTYVFMYAFVYKENLAKIGLTRFIVYLNTYRCYN